ncbi:MAG TPA: hypothetical protein VMI52_10235, partial [Acetobacteraceae bacterium]|nr:hypothetical protein [Acetobacteraceae bacterium]
MRQTMQTTGAARRTMIGAAGRADMAGTSARPWPAAPRPIITRDVAAPYDAELVIYRLEEAGSTLLALPQGGYSTRLRTQNLEIARDDADLIPAPGSEAGPLRPPVPSASRITRMDETLAWIPLIPRERHVLRRIVGARALVSPVT